MTAPLREQLQMARINRVKRRVHDWWHRERCEACQAKGGLIQAITAAVQRIPDIAEFEVTSDPSLPPKAH